MYQKLSDFLQTHPFVRELGLSDDKREELIRIIEEDYFLAFISTLIRETEDVMSIDPGLGRKEILGIAAERIVRDLGAKAASIRLFSPRSLKMLIFGAYGLNDYERLSALAVEDSVSGMVVLENRSIIVPSIAKDPLYKNKEIIEKKGFHSLMAVPLRIPRFVGTEGDIRGALQIYYDEEDRCFHPLEIIHAELLARRVSFVLAKKKILDLNELNLRKEKIVDQIFLKLSNREGIKMKDLFVLLLPELGEFMQIHSCSLFSVSDDQQYIHLDQAYPINLTYHDPGFTFTVRHHPYFKAAVHGPDEFGDRPFERFDKSYILIKDPKKSSLTTPRMREFVEEHKIHSVLLVPLKVNAKVRNLLTFYATEQKQFFSDEEIDVLIFLGKELMKASRLEFLGDMLHDFKNPALAISGIASRTRKLVAAGDLDEVRGKLISGLDVVVKEADRLQDLALTMTGEGHEEVVDLGRIARRRYHLNEEGIRNSGYSYIKVMPPELEPEIMVFCPVAGLERVIDNLLNNAVKAVPREGGVLGLRCFRDGNAACLEISNTGEIPHNQLARIKAGEVKGRGLNIIDRFVQSNHGKIDIRSSEGRTVFAVRFPLQTEV